MRNKLVVLLASAALLVASTASANVFDPTNSWLDIRIAGLSGVPVQGTLGADTRAVLTGGVGGEVVTLSVAGAGEPDLFKTTALDPGTALFTGTPLVSNLFLTVQNAAGTFTNGTSHVGTFQGNTLCTAGCFGGSSGLSGQSIIDILNGSLSAPVPLSVIGAGGQAVAVIGALTATVFVDGAQWLTGSVPITGIATNIISIINNAGGRINATGIGFTLQPTVNEDTTVLTENGVTFVTVSGTTAFSTVSGLGQNQVTLVSPTYIDASDLTSNPPLPGLGVMTLRFVPEPGTLLLLGSAVAGLLAVGRKRMKR